jgi:hypothetical protein
MANKYWVTGGTGNWNSTTNWSLLSGGVSGAPVPSTIDAVILDASSGAGSVTLDISPDIQTLTCTGFTGTLAFGTNTISLNSTGTIFTGATTMTVTGTPLIICTNSSATSRTITSTAVTEANSISFRFTAGTGGLTLASGFVRNLDFTDGANPTGFGGALGSANITVYGDLKVSTNMTVTAGVGVFTFAATSGTKTINTAGVTFDRPFTFNGVGGTFQLVSALTSGATRTVTLTNGTLDLNGYTFTAGTFSSSNSNVRTLAFGSTGKIVLANSGVSIFQGTTSTNATVTGANPVVQLSYSGGTGTRNVVMWALPESQAISVEVLNNATDIVYIQGTAGGYKSIDFTNFNGTFGIANTPRVFGNLTIGASVSTVIATGSNPLTFAATSGTKTITTNGKTVDTVVTFDGIGGTWALQDALTLGSTRTLTMTNGTLKLKSGTTSTVGAFATSGTNAKYLLSTTLGSQATISQASGTVTVNYLTIQDSNATGGATWDALNMTNTDAGGNTGWLFSSTPSIANEIEIRLRSFTQPRRF